VQGVSRLGLRKFILRRALNTVAFVFGALALDFVMLRLMIQSWGLNPIGIVPNTQGEFPELLRHWEVNQSQFFVYVANMLTFQFGNSFSERFPAVLELVIAGLPNTLLLMGAAALLSIIMSVATGLWAGASRPGKHDGGLLTTALALQSVPTFWLGMVLILLLGFCVPLFPIQGAISLSASENILALALGVGRHLVLPTITLALVSCGGYMLVMRNSLIDVLDRDYVEMARAKGVDECRVLHKYAIRNAQLPWITMIALSFGLLINGIILTETVFNWYGLGRLMYEAVVRHDYPVVQAVFYIMVLVVTIARFIVDMLRGFLDPKIRYD
jgi:peptide/nickel transport system permease protein